MELFTVISMQTNKQSFYLESLVCVLFIWCVRHCTEWSSFFPLFWGVGVWFGGHTSFQTTPPKSHAFWWSEVDRYGPGVQGTPELHCQFLESYSMLQMQILVVVANIQTRTWWCGNMPFYVTRDTATLQMSQTNFHQFPSVLTENNFILDV